jgi:hypothetical protein
MQSGNYAFRPLPSTLDPVEAATSAPPRPEFIVVDARRRVFPSLKSWRSRKLSARRNLLIATVNRGLELGLIKFDLDEHPTQRWASSVEGIPIHVETIPCGPGDVCLLVAAWPTSSDKWWTAINPPPWREPQEPRGKFTAAASIEMHPTGPLAEVAPWGGSRGEKAAELANLDVSPAGYRVAQMVVT